MRGYRRQWIWVQFILLAATMLWPATRALAQTPEAAIELGRPIQPRLFVFRSDHFELYTDLEPRETIEVLDRIEAVVSNLDVYWGRPLRGKIRCLVASDLSLWPAELMSDPAGRAKIAERWGTTVLERTTTDGRETVRPVVYAFADGQSPQREAVRAFCLQTFGRCGPDWFAEGLAEVGAHWRKDGSIACPPWMAEYLKAETYNGTESIVGGWTAAQEPWKIASHRWALCFLLATDPSYSARFRQFGQDQLAGKSVEFAERFPELGWQLDGDYRRFIDRLAIQRQPGISAVSQ